MATGSGKAKVVAKIFFSTHALVSSAPDFTRVELEILAKKKSFGRRQKRKENLVLKAELIAFILFVVVVINTVVVVVVVINTVVVAVAVVTIAVANVVIVAV